MDEKRLRMSFGLNVACVALELIGIVLSFMNHGLRAFQFYTELSNYLACVACAILAWHEYAAMRRGVRIPEWVCRLKYVAACCLTMTFVVVVVVLAPFMQAAGMSGYQMMLLSGSMLYMHLICPIICVASFVLVEPFSGTARESVLLAIKPTLAYAAVMVILNLAGVVDGPYPFLRVREQPVWASILWLIALIALSAGLSCLMWKMNRREAKGESE